MSTEGQAGAFFARKGRRLARAMTSPSTILVTGGVAAAAIATGLPALLIGAVAAVGYAAKVAVSTFTASDVREAARAGRIDTKDLREPYRGWVERGRLARDRFREGLRTAPQGPLTARLGESGAGLDEVLSGLARVARRAQGIDDYLSSPSARGQERQLQEARLRLEQTTDPAVLPQRQRTVDALTEQIRVQQRLKGIYDDAISRMESTIASLDQLSAQLMEVMLTAEDATEVPGDENRVETLIAELDSVRQAIAELDPDVPPATAAEREVEAAIAAAVPVEPVAVEEGRSRQRARPERNS